MKIYIIIRAPFPNGMAATQRIKCYARALKTQNVECEVWNYTRTEQYGKKPNNTEGSGEFEGIKWYIAGGTPLRASNVLIRQLNDRLDKYRMIRHLKKSLKPGDGVLLYCGADVEFTLKLMDVCKNKHAFFTRDLCELPYGTGEETESAIRNRKIILERQFPRLDGIIAISETLATLARTYASKDCTVIKTPIMVDYDSYKLDDRSDEVDIPYIFHSGTLYEQKDGILGVFEAFGKACQQLPFTIQFISTGSKEKSPHKAEINRIIEKYNLQDKLIFTGYLSDEELKDKLSKASLVIINKYRTQQNHYCFSTKLGEYLAAAKPVIITRVGEAMNYLKDGDNAYIVEPEDNDALASAIVRAFNYPEERKRIALSGQKTCKEYFDYKSCGRELAHFFQSLSDKCKK